MLSCAFRADADRDTETQSLVSAPLHQPNQSQFQLSTLTFLLFFSPSNNCYEAYRGENNKQLSIVYVSMMKIRYKRHETIVFGFTNDLLDIIEGKDVKTYDSARHLLES